MKDIGEKQGKRPNQSQEAGMAQSHSSQSAIMFCVDGNEREVSYTLPREDPQRQK
jgi:hypothetical protein